MDDFQKIVKNLEKEFILILIKELRGGSLKIQPAKSKTKAFLDLLPFSDRNDLRQKINLFCQKNPEFLRLELFLKKTEEEENTKKILQKMRELIRSGKIDEALIVAKNKDG